MTNQVIPAQAVEAARADLLGILKDEDNYTHADHTPEVDISEMTDALLNYLMQAKSSAWLEGYSAGFWDATGQKPYQATDTNPYRSEHE